MPKPKILFVHPRRGLYQLTICEECGHTFGCENCDAKLTTYRKLGNNLELICHQCQSYYKYPETCSKCGSHKIFSKYGGIDDLVENLERELQTKIINLSKKVFEKSEENKEPSGLYKKYPGEIFATTRIFDPSVDYSKFDKIIFVQAENLLAHLDYLVQEETYKNIAEILSQISEKTEVIFDTNTPGLDFFKDLIKLNKDHPNPKTIHQWFLKALENEKKQRELFGFPPFKNLLLLTSQEKKREKALDLIQGAERELKNYQKDLSEITISNSYPARFLKRKGMHSYHLLIKYPRQYKDFAKLRELVTKTADLYNLQVRLNPRHLF